MAKIGMEFCIQLRRKKISCSSPLQYVHIFITHVITTILYVDYLLMVVLPINYHHNLEALHISKF
jgi:hypothetical protein